MTCEACEGKKSWEREIGGLGTYMITTCAWCGGSGCCDSETIARYRKWVESNMPERKEERDEVSVATERFSRHVEERVRAANEEDSDISGLLTQLFEAVHDAKIACQGGGSVSAQAVKIGSIALRLAMRSGGMEEARKDSLLLVNARVDTVQDSSSRHAVMMTGRCVLWGAEVSADMELDEQTLDRLKPAIYEAMQRLHSVGIPAKRVEIRGGLVRAFPAPDQTDPRLMVEVIPSIQK